MLSFTVETIIKLNELGEHKHFNSERQARKFAIKQSLKAGVRETFLSGTDDDDFNFEVMEYYQAGKLSIKVS